MTLNSDEGFEYRSCRQKTVYLSMQEARHFVRRMSQKGNRFSADSKKVYACRYCGCFHLGTQTPATKAHKRAARQASLG